MAEDKDNVANAAANSCEDAMTEDEIDDTLKGTFPASDPPSWTLGSDHCSETKQQEGSSDIKKD